VYVEHLHHNSGAASTSVHGLSLQPFSKKSRTPTVAIEFQIGLYDPAEADLELLVRDFWENGCIVGSADVHSQTYPPLYGSIAEFICTW